jgi:hypothetical protein
VVDHFIQFDVGGVWISEDHHAKGIAHKYDVHAALIQQAAGGIVCGGQGANFAPCSLCCGEGFDFWVRKRHGEKNGLPADCKRSEGRLGRFQVCQEQTDGYRKARQDQIWPHVGERLEDKPAQVQPWMRNFQLRSVDDVVSVNQQIQIDWTRGISGAMRRSAAVGFNLKGDAVQGSDGFRATEYHDGIEKRK